MKKFYSVCLVLLFLLSTFSTEVLSQLKIEITQGTKEPLKIAIIPFNRTLGLSESLVLYKVISKDLESFGEFIVIPPDSMLSLPKSEDEIFYRDWRLIDVDYLVLGSIQNPSIETKDINVTYSLFDITRQKTLYRGIIAGKTDSLRILAHNISDRIYEKIKGISGIFSTKILYVSKPSFLSDNYSLKIADIDGFNDISLFSSTQPILSPDWSPDGEQIAYVSFEKGRSSIFIQELFSGKRKSLKIQPGINSSPSWSPNGRYIAAVLSKEGNPDIFLYDLKKDKWIQLTDHYGIDTEPTWASNGKKLLFTSNRSGTPQLYEINLKSKKIRRKTFEGSYNARGRYSPDNKNLIFIHRQSGLFHVASQNLRTGKIKVLTETNLDESPTVSPNGNLVIYATRKEDRGVLAGITIDGQTKFLVPSILGEVREPSWSPLLK